MRRALVLLLVVLGCAGTRQDESLAVLQVFAAADVPDFTEVRFSVPERAEIVTHLVPVAGRDLKFGYYLPGPNVTLVVKAEALSSGCVVATGTAEVNVALGQVLPLVPLALARAPVDCSGGDAGVDAPEREDAPAGAPYDAVLPEAPPREGGPDSRPSADVGVPDVRAPDATDVHDAAAPADAPPPPMCLPPVASCEKGGTCCAGTVCASNSHGVVCCSQFLSACQSDPECCGMFDCYGGKCCLKPLEKCGGTGCCPGYSCGMSSAGTAVCCGGVGSACSTANGADCCGSLLCNQTTHRCQAP